MKRIKLAVVFVVGTAGIRLDRPLGQIALTVVLIAATVGLQYLAASVGLVLLAATAAGIVYYAGNTVFCARWFSTRLRARHGDADAARAHEVFLGVAFSNQAVALGLVASHSANTLHAPAAPIAVTCVVLTVVGMVTKYWAAALTGLDVYYYRDLFLREPIGELVETGPYRWLRNPMYGLGNVHSYVPALAAASVPGLVCAAVFHAAIYGFLVLVERPFVLSLGEPEQLAATTAG